LKSILHAPAFFLPLIFVGSLFGCLAPATPALVPFDRYAAPDVELFDATGSAHLLSEFRGKVVLVNFWASWCYLCVGELPDIQALQEKFRDRMVVLGVGVRDSREALEKAEKRRHTNLPLYLDPEGRLLEAFGGSELPTSVVLDPEGRWVIFPDPANGRPVARVQGPRSWNMAGTHAAIERLLFEK